MVSHAVVAYPTLSVRDQAWIESFRRQHDPQGSLIAAHFTLVFPAPVAASFLLAEVQRALAGQEPFRIELARAVAHRDLRVPRSHVFLVPSTGGDQVRRLHERMYEGTLREHLDSNIPYVPHVTVAAKTDHAECVALAEELDALGVSLEGRIDAVEVVSIEADVLTTLAVVALGGRGNVLPRCEPA